jgi:hypothetical protein
MLVALLGVLALSALTAAAAQAVEAPRWSIEGKTLEKESETHFITAKIYTGTFRLIAGRATVACKAIKLEEGVLLGSPAGTAGKNNEIVEFTECSVTGTGIEKCTLLKPILTNPLRSELVETEKAVPGTSGSLLLLLEPAPKSEGLAKLEFTAETGGKCPPNPTTVFGSVAAQVLTDPNNAPELGKLVELPKINSTEATSWLLNFPETPIKKVTRIKGNEVTEIKVGLEAFSEEAKEVGTALILLAERNASGELVTEKAPKKWSPLP